MDPENGTEDTKETALATKPKRNTRGLKLWKKGQSGNPKGRPKAGAVKINNVWITHRDGLARAIGPRVVKNLVEGLKAKDPKVRRDYTLAVLDKLLPSLKSVEGDGPDGGSFGLSPEQRSQIDQLFDDMIKKKNGNGNSGDS